MTSLPRTSRRIGLALRLALFALFAQLALGVVSAAHHARMLAAGAGVPVEVCTPAGIELVTLAGDGSPATPDDDGLPGYAGSQCAICAVAALTPLAYVPSTPVAPAPDATRGAVLPPVGEPHARPSALPPPSQAPPRLS